ncbi:hypothetical protein HMPREF1049_1594 [Fusobacterium necrophorum subsp. funduliforme ATCC 51357]|uniref:Uncharacterized protein n=1 Tax=Fusobacterium gonidiaformans 3-1-5R TaxID=469605 RepID=E5BI14_9FUSO|nr:MULTISPECIES: hypothetical protein [Fusobacterium]EFS22137.1 hypothetical protein FSBG_01634 [Fusobacterium gonidiaformans 3-1-5R]EFS22920.1 hypothetical protein FSEG_00527 [Fusobacterium necrophorum D12]EIJ72470.1 hypothetical protein HMPREF1049_1594 [Fusobacterium necrophorum subsp. funduliforme ATCC 51357]KAB0552931.1 hypothetical protein F7P76_06095 [Fusobacterium necrophorum subsp. funduliforme]
MKNFLTMILLVFGIMFFLRENPFRSEEEKIKIKFTREFSYMEEDFYLLNEVLSVKEKDKLLVDLSSSSRGEQEKAFKELLKEKQEEINKIEDYKKIKFKKEIEENKKIGNTINSIYENNIFRAIIVIVTLLCAVIYILFPRKI